MKHFQQHNISSEVIDRGTITLDSWDTWLEWLDSQNICDGLVLAYFDHLVCWGRMVEGKLVRSPVWQPTVETIYLQRMRIFNGQKELLMWRDSRDSLRYRLRVDGQGENVPVVDVAQYLLGTKRKTKNDFTLLTESQGSAGWVPIVLSKQQRAFLLTRNYIQYFNDMLAGYVDSRLVELKEG